MASYMPWDEKNIEKTVVILFWTQRLKFSTVLSFFLPWLNKFELSEGPLQKAVSQAQFLIFFQNSFFADLEI